VKFNYIYISLSLSISPLVSWLWKSHQLELCENTAQTSFFSPGSAAGAAALKYINTILILIELATCPNSGRPSQQQRQLVTARVRRVGQGTVWKCEPGWAPHDSLSLKESKSVSKPPDFEPPKSSKTLDTRVHLRYYVLCKEPLTSTATFQNFFQKQQPLGGVCFIGHEIIVSTIRMRRSCLFQATANAKKNAFSPVSHF